MKKKFIAIAAIFTLAIVTILTGCGSGSGSGSASGDSEYTADNPLVFRIAHVEAEDTFLHQSVLKFKDYVEKETEGRVSVETYPNGELGGDEDLIKAVRMGDINMCISSSSTLAPYDERLGLLDLPFLYPDVDTMDAAIRGDLGELYASWMDENGFKCMGFQFDGSRGLSNSVRPVAKLSDMKGLKVRVMENDMYLSTFKAMGANPTPMSFNDLYTGLQQGTVDGQDNSPMLTYENKFYEVQKYYSTLNHVLCNAVVITDKKFMESLPEDIYNVMKEGADKYLLDWQREQAFAAEEDYLKKLDEGGCKVTIIDDDARAEFLDAVQSVYDKYRESVGSDTIDEVVKLASGK